MAGNLGLDASDLLPPFCPVQRNSDGLLGRTLNRCFPGACKGYLDVAALHDPPPGRSQNLDEWWTQLRSVRFPEILGALIDGDAPAGGPVQPRGALAELGSRLSAMGSSSPPSFRGRLRGQLLRRETARLNRNRSREADEMPGFYAALRARQVETIREAIGTEEYLEPRDFSADQPLALGQEIVGRFGDLLQAWPRIWDAAERLRAAGRRMAEPVAR